MKYLASRKLALALIIALAILAAVGMTIPQNNRQDDYKIWAAKHGTAATLVDGLQLNTVFNSWWIKILVTLLFINILSCTILQTKVILKNRNSPAQCNIYRQISYTNVTEDKAKQYLRTRRFTISHAQDAHGNLLITGCKNNFSRWSAVAFHVGILIVIIGILVSISARTDGIIPIMDGEQVREDSENYIILHKGILAGSHSGLPLSLKIMSVEKNPKTYQIKSFTNIVSFGSGKFLLDGKKPVSSNGFTVYLDKNYGYAPSFSFTDKEGKSTEFTFPLLAKGAQSSLYFNEISLPNTAYRMTVSLNRESYDSLQIVIKDNLGRTIAKDNLRSIKTVSFAGSRLKLNSIGYWCALRLVRDPGVGVIYLGFFICVLSLFFIYLVVPKKIQIKIKKGSIIEIGGWTGHYRNLFLDELDRLAKYLENGGLNKCS